MSAFDLYTVYDFLWFFVIYAFLGWCTEVAYAALCHGHFVNRGFLNGPVCPIYGFGVILVIAALTPLSQNGPLLFLGSVVLTSILEWVTGFILEKVFHDKWWDYSDVPFNLNGYICLKFSILWGFACMFVMNIFHPTVVSVVNWIPHLAGGILVGVLLAIFVADAAVTAASMFKLNRHLAQMEEIAGALRQTSGRIGENIAESVVELVEKTEEVREELQERREDLEEDLKTQGEALKARYEELIKTRSFIHKRILKAFPGMKSKNYEEAFEELKKRYGMK